MYLLAITARKPSCYVNYDSALLFLSVCVNYESPRLEYGFLPSSQTRCVCSLVSASLATSDCRKRGRMGDPRLSRGCLAEVSGRRQQGHIGLTLLPRAAMHDEAQGLSPLCLIEFRQPGNRKGNLSVVFYCTCWLINTTVVSLLLCCGLLPLLSRNCCR